MLLSEQCCAEDPLKKYRFNREAMIDRFDRGDYISESYSSVLQTGSQWRDDGMEFELFCYMVCDLDGFIRNSNFEYEKYFDHLISSFL